jgi:23S rRNA (cytidine2498-2'-O)-methyltransferase
LGVEIMFKNVFKCIVNISPDFLEIGMNEIFLLDNKAKISKWIEKGVVLINLSSDYTNIIEGIRNKPPIFVRHIFPVFYELSLDDIGCLLPNVSGVLDNLDTEKSFSVQVQVLDNHERPYSKYDIEENIGQYLLSKGFSLNVQEPQQAVSILVQKNDCYVGVSDTRDNLSLWTGGVQRFSKEAVHISRAEFKLLEALEYFNIEIKKNTKALDLGAAPGGWTRVLLNKDLTVYAVDPADLDERVFEYSGLKHFKETAQEFLKKNDSEVFDYLVNDMKMDAKESAFLMGQASQILKADGIGIITLKLPRKEISKKIKETKKLLQKWFEIIGIRHLYNNRHEVTIVLKKLAF